MYPRNLTVPEQSSRIFMVIQKYPAPSKVKYTMSDIQPKNIRYAKKPNTTQNEEKSQSIKTNPN